MMTYAFQIAELGIQVCTEKPMRITESFAPFVFKEPRGHADWISHFRVVGHLPEFLEDPLFSDHGISIYRQSGKIYRAFYDYSDQNKIYAVTDYSNEEKVIQVNYLPNKEKYFSESGNCFFHIGLEALMMKAERYILHASCVQTQYGGLLFSGPSGSGKSTQAKLWCNSEAAEMINDDKPILFRKEGCWFAYGSPYAGSSHYYVNDFCVVQAIIFVKKAENSTIRRLSLTEAIQRIYANLTINAWNREFVVQALDAAMKMAEEIPVYELNCLPDHSAVDILKKQLQGSR